MNTFLTASAVANIEVDECNCFWQLTGTKLPFCTVTKRNCWLSEESMKRVQQFKPNLFMINET